MMAVSPSETQTMLLQLLLITTLFGVCFTATVTVEMTPLSSENGTRTVLTCDYSIDDALYALYAVRWYNSDDFEATSLVATNVGASVPLYYNGYAQPSYVMTRDATMSSLTIAEAIWDKDNRTYGCQVEYAEGFNFPFGRANAKLTISVPPNSNKAYLKANGTPLKSGDTFTAEVGDSQTFTLTLEDILPAATFEWKLGSIKTLTERTESTTQSDGLIHSTSTAIWMPVTDHDDEVLTCTGTNGRNKINITLNLKVTVPTTSPTTPTCNPTTEVPPTDQTTVTAIPFPWWAWVLIAIGAILITVGVIRLSCYYYTMWKNKL